MGQAVLNYVTKSVIFIVYSDTHFICFPAEVCCVLLFGVFLVGVFYLLLD